MEKKVREIHVYARSNMNTFIRITLSKETDDLRSLISEALLKVSSYSTRFEEFRIEHIDSIPELKTPNLD